MKKNSDISSQRKAVTVLRILYPIWAGIGIFSLLFVFTKLLLPEDAVKTVKNIVDNEWLFRMGIVGSLIVQLLQIFVVLNLYKLFKSVNKSHATYMVVFALIGIPIAMLSTLNLVAALQLLNGADYIATFGTEQLNTLVMFFLNLYEQGTTIATIFWGLWLFPLGYLIYKSSYFPKVLGILLLINGLGYLISSCSHLLIPHYVDYEAILSVFEIMNYGEIVFMIWILFKGAKFEELKPEN